MRLLVLSDSHGDRRVLERIVSFHSDIRHVAFLGDCVRDIEDLSQADPTRTWHVVQGNCDGFCLYPGTALFEIEGHRVMAVHGHRYRVKSGTDELLRAALENGCDLALYGHTHVAALGYEQGVQLLNPGSVAFAREGAASYAVVDLVPGGVVCRVMRVADLR